jgi:uncharacterized protein (TIGR02266 family)
MHPQKAPGGYSYRSFWQQALVAYHPLRESRVAKPTFSLALLWDATSSPGAVKQLIDDLDGHFPATGVSNIGLTLSETIVCLHFSVDFSLYSKKTLAQVGSEVEKSGGRFVELARLPESKLEEFKAQFLIPTPGGRSIFKQLRSCSRALQEHLANLSKGIGNRPSTQPKARATVHPSTRPKRQASRYGCSLEVEIETNRGFIREQAMNISIGGVFVRTSERPEIDSKLGLKVRFPNGQPMQTTARVVHILERADSGGMGLEFNRNDRVFMRLLERYFSSVGRSS